ncbi:NeuD/PglB/VioB family sugar acetyltransferase [Noviherbaspirillum sp. ST9]|uniref:NeuD/PglB/VioB family sugar acetyltransferase n=1 Tax=Noviherbaspirillum sp. ST9 TaxID=3401606 RepID=UPI003B58A9A9
MNTYKGLLILGFGGHARSVADVALAAGVEELLFVDANAREGENFLGHRVVREFTGKLPEHWACLPAAGDNERRQNQLAEVTERGWVLATLIAPGASIGAGASIGEGSFVARHAHVGPMARVGKGSIINTGAAVEHECIVGDFVHVSVNATLAGRSRLGDFVFLGAGGTVIDSVEVGAHITIGAGGVVVASIASPGTYVGVPAKRLEK